MIHQKHFREVLGSYPSGIVIVTARDGDERLGVTLQTFHSLSLDPPLVAFFPGKSSSSWPRIAAAGRFCINVLAQDQGAIAYQFASKTDKFADLRTDDDAWGCPRIPGCIAHISCSLESITDGGDHHIVVGRVEELSADGNLSPLIYFRGGFWSLDDTTSAV